MNLVAIALGPVQDFIAAARRTRDLWFGSYMLSELSKAAARAVHQRSKLIFPYHNDLTRMLQPGSDFTVANKLLFVTEEDDPRSLHDAAKVAVQEQLRNFGTHGLKGTHERVGIYQELFDAQLDSLVELYAAWVPYDPGQHAEARRQVELLLAARKTLRNFPVYVGVDSRPKSSLDGFRESVLIEGSRSEDLFESNLKGNEQLDAVGVIKRFAEPVGGIDAPDFDSTLEVAAVPYFERVRKSQAFPAYEAFIRRYHRLVHHRKRSLLYESESRQLYDLNGVRMEELKPIRQAIYKACGRPKPPYYAVLIGDGDFMGRAIDRISELKEHRRFSQDLSGFAARAKAIIVRHQGCPIYVGGDDVTALLPVHSALACAQELHDVFAGEIERGVSFSAGIVIAHALDPLSETLRIARQTEARAKAVPKKDAVAVTLCPHSGANVEAEGKWESLTPLLDELATLYSKGNLSFGFAHELRDLERQTPPELDPILKDLALRAAAKKQENQAAQDLVEKHVSSARDARRELRALYQAMLIARPVYRARKEAGV
jgi:CRISPR-associated protein Cmr2